MESKLIELVTCAKNGNMEAFSELIMGYEQDLYRIASIRGLSENDIDDVIQITIEKALKNIKKLRHPEFAKTWLIKILINNCNKFYQRRKYKEENVEDFENQTSEKFCEEIHSKLDFYNLIKDLNYDERVVLTLYYSEDLTTKEISQILKERESTIRNRKARALSKLKERFIKGVGI